MFSLQWILLLSKYKCNFKVKYDLREQSQFLKNDICRILDLREDITEAYWKSYMIIMRSS